MASVFASRFDCYLRPGDYVRSLTSTSANRLLDVSQRPQLHSRFGESAMMSASSCASRRSGAERSATLHDSDLSSVESWWESVTQGTWLEEKEEAPRVGVIQAVDRGSKTATVIVWMRGNEQLVELPRKPIETFRLDRLEKLSVTQFNEICRKKFMHATAHHLKLRGEGYDESAPFALIAYNNRVISELIGKIDTTAKMSMKDLKVHRPRGPGDLIRSPIPTMVPIEDPLANARAELEALQETGLVQTKRRHITKLSSKPSEDASLTGAQRCVSSRLGDRSGSVQQSFVEDTVEVEKNRVHSSIRVASAPLQAMGRPKAVLPILPDRCFPPRADEGTLTVRDSDGENGKLEMRCVVADVLPTGLLLLRPARGSEPPFVARLAYIELWRDASVQTLLQSLIRQEVSVVPKFRDVSGVCSCDLILRGTSMIERILSEGCATLQVPVLEEAATLLGASAAATLQSTTPRNQLLARWSEAQDIAIQEQRGLWSSDARGTSTDAADLAQTVDASGSGDEHLPPLFQAFESSQGFRAKLLDKLQS